MLLRKGFFPGFLYDHGLVSGKKRPCLAQFGRETKKVQERRSTQQRRFTGSQQFRLISHFHMIYLRRTFILQKWIPNRSHLGVHCLAAKEFLGAYVMKWTTAMWQEEACLISSLRNISRPKRSVKYFYHIATTYITSPTCNVWTSLNLWDSTDAWISPQLWENKAKRSRGKKATLSNFGNSGVFSEYLRDLSMD